MSRSSWDSRNTLVFLAADLGRLEDLRTGVRQWMAWRSINADAESLNLDAGQAKQARTKEAELDELVDARILETWQWLIVPAVPSGDPTGEVRYETTRVGGAEPLAARAAKKLKSEEGLVTEYSGVRLRLDLDRFLWGAGDHVRVDELRDAYAKYLYLPRLRDESVLHAAVRDGAAKLTWASDTFALAEAHEGDGDTYRGLVAGAQVDAAMGSTAVLVKPERAQTLLAAGSAAAADEQEETEAGSGGETNGAKGDDAAQPTRFYGRIELDPVRFGRQLGQISDEVIAQLKRGDGVSMTLTFEIEATSSDGFDDAARRAVGENASTLKFDEHRFDDD